MEIGTWMRNKETGEAVKITSIASVMIGYANNEVDGEVQAARLAEHFDVLDDPISRDDIEFLLKTKIEAEEAEIGLYYTGISHVLASRVMTGQGEVIAFQWFDHAMQLGDVVNR